MTGKRAKQFLATISDSSDRSVSPFSAHNLAQYTQVIIDTFGMIILLLLIINNPAQANPAMGFLPNPAAEKNILVEKPKPSPPLPVSPEDDFNRGTPHSSLKGYLYASNEGDYELAANYLDLRYLPNSLTKKDGPLLAKKLKIILDRSLLLDMDLVSNDPRGHQNDGIPKYRDSLGKIKVVDKSIALLLQQVPRKDGVNIWKFSNRTVARIPLLYEHHGYSPVEEYLEGVFPDFQIMGWHSWQWATYFILIGISYLIALIVTLVLFYLLKPSTFILKEEINHFLSGPIRITLWVILAYSSIDLLGPSDQIRSLHQAATLLYFTVTWAIVRLVDLLGLWFIDLLKRKERHAAQVLLKPIKTIFKIFVILTGVLLWLDNIGLQVSTLLASLGIGGLAFALASQDMLKNLLGSIMILIDRPYEIGQRIIAKGHDGIIEEIGLRSTKMRLLNGHQATIPNEEMAKIDIENIGRRPHIKRSSNIAIPLNTPIEKVSTAVQIIKDNLNNHECMHESFPPRVFFNEFNRDSLNIQMMFWYRSSDYWAFQAYNEKLNLKIMQDFAAAGIQFALPSFNSFSELNQNADPNTAIKQSKTGSDF